jgi:hypothetical protein
MTTRSESRAPKALVALGVALLFVGSFWAGTPISGGAR